jgi:serine protease inhibitor
MKTYFIIILALIASCNGQRKVTQDVEKNQFISDSVVEMITNDIQHLSFELLKTNTTESNVILSPLNTYYNLLPVFFGANGNSISELRNIYKINNEFNGYAGIKEKLASDFKSSDYEFSSFNAIWFDNRFSFLENYNSFIKNQLQFDIKSKDFSDLNALSNEVNSLVTSKTNNKIEKIIEPDDLVNSRMLIANTIYFKSTWDEAFDKSKSVNGKFIKANKTHVDVKFMNKTSNYKYFENEFYQFIELNYKENEAGFYVLLPKEKVSLKKAIGVFQESYDNAIKQLKEQKVDLTLPKLTVNVKTDMKSAFQDIGISEIFSDEANLSRMTGNKELFVGKIVQAIMFTMDEEGSEASAANVTVVKEKSASMTTKMNVNRPYVFFVKNKLNDVIIFSGIINDPS